ncbi:MAG: FAD-binding oxidoreductase, partial [Candidatus Poribacteria bacterium]|nr:FAD-binding oxidoreductase [Candidatus Poribacteria bacterium]
MPDRIELPDTESDLQQILFAETPQQLILAGNGSKLGMGNRPGKVDLLLSVARLNGVIEYVPDDLTVTV